MKDLKELLSKNGQVGKKHYPSFGTGPDADWKVILLSSIALLVVIIALDLKIFFAINSESIGRDDIAVEETEAVLNLNKLKKTVEYYQAKETQFELIRNGTATSTIVDPSL